jgi:hypothetical protein
VTTTSWSPAVPPGAVAVIVVEFVTLTFVAVLLPIFTVTPTAAKPVPVMVTGNPPVVAPPIGEMPVTVGIILKVPVLIAVPLGVVTDIVPVAAAPGTTAVIDVFEIIV